VITGAIEDAAARRVIAGEPQASVAGWCTGSLTELSAFGAESLRRGIDAEGLEVAQICVEQRLPDEERHDRPEREERAERDRHLARGQPVACEENR
jgi:hypothetical protein